MVSGGRLLPWLEPVRSLGGAGRQSLRLAVELARSEGSFLAGDQSGDGAQHGVEMLALGCTNDLGQ